MNTYPYFDVQARPAAFGPGDVNWRPRGMITASLWRSAANSMVRTVKAEPSAAMRRTSVQASAGTVSRSPAPRQAATRRVMGYLRY